jgi:tRNA-binding protein
MTETFQEYSARLLSLSAGADPFTVLAQTAPRIAAAIAGRRVADLQWTPVPSRWSIAQIVAHLADSEIVFAYRVRMILSTPGTPIQAYDQDAWSRAQHAESSDAHASLALFAALRPPMLRLLRSLTAEELDRYGLHAERGQESVRHLLALYSGHDRNHLAQIDRLLAERDADSAPAAPAFTPAPPKPEIDPQLLEQLDVRVGTIRTAAAIAGTDRLALLTVDFGDRTRSIVAGIRAERRALADVVGAQALFVVNLPRKTIRGQLSEGMLFDAGFADGLRPAFAQPEWPLPDGVRAG